MFRIKNGPRVIEEHTTAMAAHRALLILNAHEFKNGRGRDFYRVEPPIDLSLTAYIHPPLPEWVVEALGLEDL